MSIITVRDLRRRWKPTKERLNAAGGGHPTAVRLHRAFSWLDRAEQAEPDDTDVRLLCSWIALNALYSQWDPGNREPLPDRQCLRTFLDRVLALDESSRIGACLTDYRDLVREILDDEYVSAFFWQDPGEVHARKSRKAGYDSQTWFVEENWSMLLSRTLERVYLLRCQLVHGAATWNGRLNRDAIDRCVRFLETVLREILVVVIDGGISEDWGPMCYPPLSDD